MTTRESTGESAETRRARKNLASIFRPRSIAVIGASRRPGSIGREILYNIVDFEFQGKVYPVNPQSDVVHSMKCYKSVLEIPDPVDMAVVAVPARSVRAVIEECGRKGVAGLVVITAGFREVGSSGEEAEAEIVEICQRYGMRMIGPNCMGVVNTDSRYRLNATFAPGRPHSGRIAFLSQSGALGVAILQLTRRTGLGVSMFASIGNKADVNASHLLEYWGDDRGTDIILMYLESFGDPSAFTRIARRVSRSKPIVLVKSGTTEAGARAAAGHTGALAGREAAIQALCAQCGLIRVSSIDELFDVGKALSTQPLPKGDRVAVVTNAGGPAIMATDALTGLGFEMATFTEETCAALKAGLPPEASIENPIDMIAGAGVAEFDLALSRVLEDPGVDAAVVIFVPPIMIDPVRVSRRIFRVARRHAKPVLGCFMAEEEVLENILALQENQIPIYRFPEATAQALAALRERREWQERPEGKEVQFEVDRAEAEAIFENASGEWLSPPDAFRILEIYGLPVVAPRPVARSGDLPDDLEYPVVLKASGVGLVHKSDAGGVRTGIENAEELEEARATMLTSLREHGLDLDVIELWAQREVPSGRELILGLSSDSTFGPLLLFGLGGIYVEVLGDVAFRNHPLTDQDAHELVRELRGHAILEGVRGDAPVDFSLLEEVVLRLDQLVGDLGAHFESLEINPFIAHEQGGFAVDCRVKLHSSPASP